MDTIKGKLTNNYPTYYTRFKLEIRSQKLFRVSLKKYLKAKMH